MIINDREYTKHYYIEGQRICSSIGGGMMNNPRGLHDELAYLHDSYANMKVVQEHKIRSDANCVGISPDYLNLPPAFEHLGGQAGRDEVEKDRYFYHSDHIGSSSFITDNDGITTQHLQYLPFGETFVEQQSGAPYNTAYKFSGKEKDEETGYSYFGARYYLSDISIWGSVDPMADKYPQQTPFSYCGWRPINVIDPDGRDEWELNAKGETTKHIETKAHDAFYIVDNKGNRIEGKSKEFAYGTVTGRLSYSANKKDSHTGKSEEVNIDLIGIKGDKQGEELFKFLSNNTNVEWGNFQLDKNENGLNMLSTSHKLGTEFGSGDIKNNIKLFGINARNHDHNHPRNTPYPSPNDKNFSSDLESFSPSATTRIYTKKNGIFQYYNEFGNYANPVVITSKKIKR